MNLREEVVCLGQSGRDVLEAGKEKCGRSFS